MPDRELGGGAWGRSAGVSRDIARQLHGGICAQLQGTQPGPLPRTAAPPAPAAGGHTWSPRPLNGTWLKAGDARVGFLMQFCRARSGGSRSP